MKNIRLDDSDWNSVLQALKEAESTFRDRESRHQEGWDGDNANRLQKIRDEMGQQLMDQMPAPPDVGNDVIRGRKVDESIVASNPPVVL